MDPDTINTPESQPNTAEKTLAVRVFTDGPTDADLEDRFTYHSPNAAQAKVFPSIRNGLCDVAKHIRDNTPKSREQSLALTALEEAMFWANAAVARHQGHYEVVEISNQTVVR